MATPVRSQPAPSVSAILDQLDELEALMQRMLAVPAHPGEDAPEPAEATSAERPAAEPVSPRPPEAAGPPQLFANGTPSPLAPRQEPAPRDEEQGKPAPPPWREPSRPAIALPWVAPARAVPRQGWRRPLLWIDAGFERWTHALGPAGRCLAGDAGRAVLGTLGLLLVAGALAWGVWNWRTAHSTNDRTGAVSLAPRAGD